MNNTIIPNEHKEPITPDTTVTNAAFSLLKPFIEKYKKPIKGIGFGAIALIFGWASVDSFIH